MNIFRRMINKRKERKLILEKEKEKLQKLNDRRPNRRFNVRGATYNDRQYLLNNITRRHGYQGIGKIKLVPEPDNKYDPNAIGIIFEDVGHIGYVPKELTESIAKFIDKDNFDVKWDIEWFENERSQEILYMEVRLYTKK